MKFDSWAIRAEIFILIGGIFIFSKDLARNEPDLAFQEIDVRTPTGSGRIVDYFSSNSQFFTLELGERLAISSQLINGNLQVNIDKASIEKSIDSLADENREDTGVELLHAQSTHLPQKRKFGQVAGLSLQPSERNFPEVVDEREIVLISDLETKNESAALEYACTRGSNYQVNYQEVKVVYPKFSRHICEIRKSDQIKPVYWARNDVNYCKNKMSKHLRDLSKKGNREYNPLI